MAHLAMEHHNSSTKGTRENSQNCRYKITFETGIWYLNTVNSWALPFLLSTTYFWGFYIFLLQYRFRRAQWPPSFQNIRRQIQSSFFSEEASWGIRVMVRYVIKNPTITLAELQGASVLTFTQSTLTAALHQLVLHCRLSMKRFLLFKMPFSPPGHCKK